MTMAYTFISRTTVSSNTATVTLDNLTQTFRDLVIVVDGTLSEAASASIRFNNRTDLQLPYINVQTNGNSTQIVLSDNSSLIVGGDLVQFNTNRFMIQVNIFDYTQTDKHKSVLSRFSSGQNGLGMTAGRFPATTAVTRLDFQSWMFAPGTTFTVWGVSA